MAAWPQRSSAAALCLAGLALLAGCSTPPPGQPAVQTSPGASSDAERDGPPLNPPPDLTARPDPPPRIEAIRSGGPNKPYEVLGQRYTPLAGDEPVSETGLASWYGRKFHGRRTASGEVYDMYASSAAHRTMPIPSYARVRNPANGREVVVRVNDRGPFHKDRVIDLSYAAALKLGVLRGVAPVEVTRLTHEDIRTGRWRGEAPAVASAPAVAPPGAAAEASQTAAATAASAASPVAPATATAKATAPAAALATPTATTMPAATTMPTATATSTSTSTSMAMATPAPTPTAKATAGATPRPEPQARAYEQVLDSRGDTATAARAPAHAASGFWVQLGAFRQSQSASELRQQLMRELAWIEPWLAIFDDNSWFKLQVGPFATRAEAHGMAERVRGAAAVQPLILQRR